jgi:hypothetical protein
MKCRYRPYHTKHTTESPYLPRRIYIYIYIYVDVDVTGTALKKKINILGCSSDRQRNSKK